MKTCLKNLWDTDVEFIERMDLFLKDVEDEPELNERTRTLAICRHVVVWMSGTGCVYLYR